MIPTREELYRAFIPYMCAACILLGYIIAKVLG